MIDDDTNMSNLSTQHLVDLYSKCRHSLNEYKKQYAFIEKELLTRKDIPGTTSMNSDLSSKLLMNGSDQVVSQTLRYYRPHSKKGTVEKITSFLTSYIDQLQKTTWDNNSITNLSQGIGNYLWQKRVVRERARIVFARRNKRRTKV